MHPLDKALLDAASRHDHLRVAHALAAIDACLATADMGWVAKAKRAAGIDALPSGPAGAAQDALLIAARAGRLEGLKLLIPRSNLSRVDAQGMTALSQAAWHGHAACVEALAAAGCDKAHRARATRYGLALPTHLWTPLMLAASRGHADAVRALLAAGCDPSQGSHDSDPADGPLALAAAGGFHECVEALLAAGASPMSIGSRDGRSTLVAAAAVGSLSCVLLLAPLCDPAARDMAGLDALAAAAAHGHADCLGPLALAGCDVDGFAIHLDSESSTPPWTPLMFAAAAGHAACVAELLALGANPNWAPGPLPGQPPTCALELAASRGHAQCEALLVAAGATIDRIQTPASPPRGQQAVQNPEAEPPPLPMAAPEPGEPRPQSNAPKAEFSRRPARKRDAPARHKGSASKFKKALAKAALASPKPSPSEALERARKRAAAARSALAHLPARPADASRFESHPLGFLRELQRRHGPDVQLTFARYRYAPQTMADERERFAIRLGDADAAWLAGVLDGLEEGQNLALESSVVVEGQTLHIPMLDMDGILGRQLSALTVFLASHRPEKAFFYFSGRSFHVYFPELLDAKQWERFMGAALLCNLPGLPPAVDARWVGHRLLGGHGALRWSMGAQYLAMPSRVPAWVLDADDHDKAQLPAWSPRPSRRKIKGASFLPEP